MISFIREFCRLCEGYCCRGFPVWQFLRNNRIMSAEFVDVGTRNVAIDLAFYQKDYLSLDCFYRELGGCTDSIKPDACRYYICKRFDNMLLGLSLEQSEKTSVVKEATLRIYKSLIKMEVGCR